MIGSVTAPPQEPEVAYITSKDVLTISPDSNISSLEQGRAHDTTTHAAIVSALSPDRLNQFRYEMFNATVSYVSEFGTEDLDEVEDDMEHSPTIESTSDDDNEHLVPVDEHILLPSNEPINSTAPAPSICTLQASPFDTNQQDSPNPTLDQEFLTRIFMAQRFHGAPSNLVYLLQNNLISRPRVEQILLGLQERAVSPFSPQGTSPTHPTGSGTLSSPIDLTDAPSPQVIDLTSPPPSPAVLAATTTLSLAQEPPSTIRNTQSDAVQSSPTIQGSTQRRPLFTNDDNTFNPSGMEDFSA